MYNCTTFNVLRSWSDWRQWLGASLFIKSTIHSKSTNHSLIFVIVIWLIFCWCQDQGWVQMVKWGAYWWEFCFSKKLFRVQFINLFSVMVKFISLLHTLWICFKTFSCLIYLSAWYQRIRGKVACRNYNNTV